MSCSGKLKHFARIKDPGMKVTDEQIERLAKDRSYQEWLRGVQC